MAGSLVLVDSETVSSGVSAVTLTNINSTYDVYKLIISGLEADTDSSSVQIRVTKSGTAQSDSEYDEVAMQFKAYTTFANNSDTNATSWGFNAVGTTSGSAFNLTAYLFNFDNASEYSFATFEATTSDTTIDFRGNQGSGVHTVASASDGVSIHLSTGGNIDSGEFKLYGLRK
tara:strand:- start:96 stop:614 length:519 start_codon:yes stop_codon:yes gene_type:complete